MMTFLFYTVPILLIGFIIALIAAGRDEKKIVKKTELLFQEIDEKYNDFIEKSLNLEVISQQKEPVNVDEILQQSFTLLKSDIDGIVSFINAVTYQSIELKHTSKYFKGATSLTQAYFRKTGSGSESTLSKEDIDKYYDSFKDAIKSDLTRRLLDLRTDNYLD
jgi:hypothetical protein